MCNISFHIKAGNIFTIHWRIQRETNLHFAECEMTKHSRQRRPAPLLSLNLSLSLSHCQICVRANKSARNKLNYCCTSVPACTLVPPCCTPLLYPPAVLACCTLPLYPLAEDSTNHLPNDCEGILNLRLQQTPENWPATAH